MNRKERRAILREQHRHISKLPEELTLVPESEWPNNIEPRPLMIWRSRSYLVQIYRETKNGIIRLSVCRSQLGNDGRWKDGLSWDELQTIKHDLGFGDFYAVEVYPRDKDVVNDANIRHLWVLPVPLDIGWFKS